MRTYLTLVLILTLFVSCRKNYTISGRIYNAETGIGVPNSKVYFTPKIKKGQDVKTIELTTDENGNYTHTDKVNLNKAQRILFGDFQTHEYHLLAPYERALLDGKKENVENLAFLRVAPAFLFFTDTDTNSWSETKTIYLKFSSKLTSSYYNDKIKFFNVFNGQKSNRSSLIQLVEGWNYFDGFANSNGNARRFYDSLYVTPSLNDSLIKNIYF
jgi:hypothetical protein